MTRRGGANQRPAFSCEAWNPFSARFSSSRARLALLILASVAVAPLHELPYMYLNRYESYVVGKVGAHTNKDQYQNPRQRTEIVGGRAVSNFTFDFIHPTKSGGTAIGLFFGRNCSKLVRARHHRILARDVMHPIVVVRDPYERAESMFLYWKYGSPTWPRDEAFLREHQNLTVEAFFDRVEHHPRSLVHGHTWEDHWSPTSHWIRRGDYHKTIAVMYDRNMTYVLQPFAQFAGRTCESTTIPVVNVANAKEKVVWTTATRAIVKRIYADDFSLLDTMEHEPERFALVIKPN